MPTHNELANREWVGDLKEKMGKMIHDVPESSSLTPVPLSVITSFSSHFAEWEVKESDILIHVFPRAGAIDKWVVGHYISRCRSCRSEVPTPSKLSQMIPCEKCGHSGLVYVPSRAESSSNTSFPTNMVERVKAAADVVWAGDIAVERASVLRYGDDANIEKDEPVETDMKAYVIQFQKAKNTANVMGPHKFVDSFCEALDAQLDK